MRLSKTSEYVIRTLSYMANSHNEVYSVKTLHDITNIPPKYLRKIMTDLCKYNFVESIKGRSGGFKFKLPPEKIFLADIVDAIDDIDKYLGCFLGFSECSCENPCSIHKFWIEAQEILKHTLRTTSLADSRNANIKKY